MWQLIKGVSLTAPTRLRESKQLVDNKLHLRYYYSKLMFGCLLLAESECRLNPQAIGAIAHWAEALTGIRKLSIFPLFVITLNPYNSG